MKRLVATSIVLASILAASLVGATPGPKYLGPNAAHPIHWFKTGSGSSDVPPSSMTLHFHFDNTAMNGVTNAQLVQAVKDGMTQWTSIACTNLLVDMSEAPSASNHTGFASDNRIVISFNNPGGDLPSGALAATTTPYQTGGGDVESLNGLNWYRIFDFDIVFPKNFTWSVHGQACSEGAVYDVQSTAVHELGHGIGFAHSCEQGDPCQDSELFSSIMYWQAHSTCEEVQANAWDLQEQAIAYGIGASSDFTADTLTGGLPLTVNFAPVLITSSTLLSASWNFGDGQTSTTAAPSHTYTTEGIFSVRTDLTANSPACGGSYVQTVRKDNLIKACNPVMAAFHYEHSGKSFTFHSDTLGQATGCLSSLDWDFGDGSAHAVTNSPTHTYTTGGTYNVTLTATGAAGTSVPLTKVVSTASAKKKGLFSCSVDEAPTANTAAAAGSLAAALALCGLMLSRRRRAR